MRSSRFKKLLDSVRTQEGLIPPEIIEGEMDFGEFNGEEWDYENFKDLYDYLEAEAFEGWSERQIDDLIQILAEFELEADERAKDRWYSGKSDKY